MRLEICAKWDNRNLETRVSLIDCFTWMRRNLAIYDPRSCFYCASVRSYRSFRLFSLRHARITRAAAAFERKERPQLAAAGLGSRRFRKYTFASNWWDLCRPVNFCEFVHGAPLRAVWLIYAECLNGHALSPKRIRRRAIGERTSRGLLIFRLYNWCNIDVSFWWRKAQQHEA